MLWPIKTHLYESVHTTDSIYFYYMNMKHISRIIIMMIIIAYTQLKFSDLAFFPGVIQKYLKKFPGMVKVYVKNKLDCTTFLAKYEKV